MGSMHGDPPRRRSKRRTRVAPLQTIAQVAKDAGIPERTARRKLLRMHALNVEANRGDAGWLVRSGSVYQINVPLLVKAWPSWGRTRVVTAAEREDMEDRLEIMEGRLAKVTGRVHSHQEEIKSLRSQVKALNETIAVLMRGMRAISDRFSKGEKKAGSP